MEIHILSSSLNHSILKDLPWCTVSIKKHILKDVDSVFLLIVKQLRRMILSMFKPNKGKSYDKVFVDLIGEADVIKEYYDEWYACLWPNMYLNTTFLSYALPYNYRWPVVKNLIDFYIDLIDGWFNLSWAFRSYVYDHIQAFYDIDDNVSKKGMMIFVGNKKRKNLDEATWTTLIWSLSKHFPDETISVIDDDTNALYNMFQSERFAWNVHLIKNTFSLDEFKRFASGFRFILWTDGGGMNLIRSMTNTLIIYPSWPENYRVRSWFVWKVSHPSKEMKSGKLGLHIDEVLWKKFWYIYKQHISDPYSGQESDLERLIFSFLAGLD